MDQIKNAMDVLVSEGNIDEIEKRLEYLEKNFDVDCDIPKLNDNKITIGFYRDPLDLSISDFLRYTDNIDSIRKIDKSTVKSNSIRQTIIGSEDYKFEELQNKYIYIETCNYKLSLIETPFYIGLVADK